MAPAFNSVNELHRQPKLNYVAYVLERLAKDNSLLYVLPIDKTKRCTSSVVGVYVWFQSLLCLAIRNRPSHWHMQERAPQRKDISTRQCIVGDGGAGGGFNAIEQADNSHCRIPSSFLRSSTSHSGKM